MATSGGTKRPSSDSEGGPAPKKPTLLIPTLDIGPVTGEEDLDIKVLKVQNRKLSERLRERNRYHANLEQRIESFEQKQDSHSRLVVGLRRMLTSLKNQLSVLCAPLCQLPDKELSNQMIANVGESPEALEVAFQCLNDSVTMLGEAVSKEVELKEDVDVAAMLRQLAEEGRERGNHDDDLELLKGKVEELNSSLADARFDLLKSQSRCEQLELQLMHVTEELAQRPLTSTLVEEKSEEVGKTTAQAKSSTVNTPTEETEKLSEEFSDLKALAEARLTEITALTKQLASVTIEREAAIEERKKPPCKEVVVESAVYKSLQSQYSMAVQEIGQLKNCFEEAKQMLMSAKQQHFITLDEIRSEELKYQALVREEMAQLENALITTQREHELLKVDYERTMASNEQAGPRARELQVTVTSLQKAITQSKAEVNRYKNRAHKAEQELAKSQAQSKEPKLSTPVEPSAPDPSSVEDKPDDIAARLKTLLEEKTELEIELTSLKAASGTEVREKAELIVSEKKHRAQVEELKKKFELARKDYDKRKEHIREEAGRRAKSLAEDNRHLQKELSAKKHEAAALVSEMECTAQAFEEMQEQNIRLLEQIKEKDDANFKLMSERIKSNSVHKLLLQEKTLMQTQLTSLNTEKQRMNELVMALQDKDRNADLSTSAIEKELAVKNQALEAHKRKAQESVQMHQESALTLAEVQKETENVRTTLASKQEELEAASLSSRRLQEEIGTLKRKLEKYKSREWAGAGDEVLLEEIKSYKVKLNCPCCSIRKKDTVLTKCFHVFCSECIKSRYDSRLRKCPKCGAAFGANDFHKIYLS